MSELCTLKSISLAKLSTDQWQCWPRWTEWQSLRFVERSLQARVVQRQCSYLVRSNLCVSKVASLTSGGVALREQG